MDPAAMAGVQLCREMGNSAALSPFAKREVMPGNLKGAELERFVRDAVMTYWHQTGTAKMGRDATSVVDAALKVHGIEHLRIADGSIMPRVTTGNTVARTVRRSWPTDQPVAISSHIIRTAPR
jgi:choline dehydrogenase